MSDVQERNRITCVLNLYHEQHGEQPVGTRLAFSELLRVNAQCYSRRMRVGEKEVPLDTGWLSPEDVGYIVIENHEGSNLQTNPSPEERQDIEQRLLLVQMTPQVAPRRFILLQPQDFSSISLRCLHGSAKASITVYPR